MPLDRRITVNVTAPGGRNEHGEYVDGATTTLALWADVMTPDLEAIAEEGRGSLSVLRRDWRLRYRADIALSIPSNVTVTDGTLDTQGNLVVFVCQNILEETGRRAETRRRFLRLQGQKTL